VPAARSDFAGFVFKIQANLDPRHRDRVAFVRVCAGRFFDCRPRCPDRYGSQTWGRWRRETA